MSQDSDDLTTQPTATALMERVRQVEVRLAQEIDTLATRLERQILSLHDQISSLREEMVKGFRTLDSKVMTLNEDTLSVRASQREIVKRMSDLEITVKAS